MTDTHAYINPATQAERKAVLENDTYHARAQHSVDDAGGRFQKLTPANITGTASEQLPKLPKTLRLRKDSTRLSESNHR